MITNFTDFRYDYERTLQSERLSYLLASEVIRQNLILLKPHHG